MIEVKRINKKFGERPVLEDISFNVEKGEFLSITGQSGAGKTTLIFALIKALDVDAGEIFINGTDLRSLKPRDLPAFRRDVGVVFQDYKLIDKMTVFENIAFAMHVFGFRKADISERTPYVLRLVGLEDHRNKFPYQLSGGEMQKCSIARAIAYAPNLLILDEPTGNLDPKNALDLKEILEKINQTGTTIILATHDKDIVDLLRKRVIKLENGKILWDKECVNYYGK